MRGQSAYGMIKQAVTGQMIVWTIVLGGIAALIAWFTPMAAGSTADWFAGVGAIFAAGVALNIATRDRRDVSKNVTMSS